MANDVSAFRPRGGQPVRAAAAPGGQAPGGVSSPELMLEQFGRMLAELDAICRQARELSTQIRLQMDQQQSRDRQLLATLRFPRSI